MTAFRGYVYRVSDDGVHVIIPDLADAPYEFGPFNTLFKNLYEEGEDVTVAAQGDTSAADLALVTLPAALEAAFDDLVVPSATTTVEGVTRYATTAETTAQSVSTAAVTPASLLQVLATKMRVIHTGTAAAPAGTATKTVVIGGYTLTAGDIIAVTLTNGNTSTAPTITVIGDATTGPVTVQQTGPRNDDFEANPDGVWLLYYTGSVFVLLNSHVPVDANAANRLVSGVETFSRHSVTSNAVPLVSQRLSCVFFTSDKTFTATQVRSFSGGTAAAGTVTARMGLYLVNGDNTLTLLASTTNDTAMWGAANTTYTKTLSASVSVTRGQRYVLAFLFDGTTPPTLHGQLVNNGNIFTYTPRLVGDYTGQTTIAASHAAATGLATARPFGVVLP